MARDQKIITTEKRSKKATEPVRPSSSCNNEKFHLIRKGDSWWIGGSSRRMAAVAKELSEGKIVGVDLEGIAPIPGITPSRGHKPREAPSIWSRKPLEEVPTWLSCDAAPNLSGAGTRTCLSSTWRAQRSKWQELLKARGNFLVKVFQGDMFQLLAEVKRDFSFVQAHSPAASRKESAADLSSRQAPPYGSGAPGRCHGCAD